MYKLGIAFFGVIVEQIESKFDEQVRFWAVLGPFIMLMTLFVMVIRSAPEDLYLAVTALVGIPVCWKWKHTGLALAFAFLGFGLVFSLIQAPIEERFWYFGISLAIGMAFIVTSLSLEEVTSIISKLQFESKSRKDHLWSLDERYQLAKAAWEKEKLSFNKEINQKLTEIVVLRSQLKQEDENKVSQNNDQIEQYRKNYFRLESELQYAKNKQQQTEIESANLKRLAAQHETELREQKQKESELLNKIDVLEIAKKHLLSTLNSEKTSIANVLIENRKMSEELAGQEDLQHQIQQLKDAIQEKNEAVAVLQNEIIEKSTQIEGANQHFECITVPKDPFEPLYKQLRDQFIEKTSLLEQTRKELFKSKEALLTLIAHHKEKINEMENTALVQLESEYRAEIVFLEEALKANQEEIEDLYVLVSSLMKNI